MTVKRKTNPVAIHDDSYDGIARRTFVSLLVVAAFVVGLGFIYEVREVLVWLIIALVIALALAPAVDWLVAKRIKRVLASVIAIFTTVVVVVSVVSAAATPLVSQGTKLVDNFPGYLEDFTKNERVKKFNDRLHITDEVEETVRKIPEFVAGENSPIVDTAKGTFSAAAATVVIFTLALFMLIEGPTSWQRFIALLRPHDAKRVDRIGKDISKSVGGYVSGNLFISLLAGLVTFVALSILDVPYAFPLAVLVAILDLIPMVGATIGTIVVVLVALSVGWINALVLLAILVIYQQVENNAIQPLVYSRTVRLSPLLILVAMLIGASLGGIIGVLLAIPVASAVQIVVVELLQGTGAGRRAHISRSKA